MSSSSDNQFPLSAIDFAQHLRIRAEQAVAASVQHASLSERYLDLSRQFVALSQKATAIPTVDLQEAMEHIESAMADFPQTALNVPESRQGTVGGFPKTKTSSQTEESVCYADSPLAIDEPDIDASRSDAPAEGDVVRTVSRPPVELECEAPLSSASSTALAGRRRGRLSRLPTRTFVERVRSVSLGLTRRVRVKAGKEDLKPQQRKALEELHRSRGSILTSVTVVVLALFILSLITLRLEIAPPITLITASFADEMIQNNEPLPVEIPEEEQGEQEEEESQEPVEALEPAEEIEEPMEDTEPSAELVDRSDEPEIEAENIPSNNDDIADVSAVGNRSTAGRKKMLEKFGGSAASESSVQRGLDWLVSVQHPNGWWDFSRVGEAGNPGRINNPIGATSYALMPFLAAGQTHRDGRYRKHVQAGLEYLSSVGVSAPAGYDLRGVMNKGNEDKEPNEAYYVHGAATLVLCEAYGMTKEKRLRRPAEGALQFLVNSQDPRGGGWRYLPQQPGSTSVTAIQVMALMAAKNAKLKVPVETLEGVMKYLDSVQVDGEGRYGYEAQRKTYKGSVTAMALLCRMYLGWGRDDGDMRAGVALLDRAGPYENLYTTYFATQVMRNWGGEEWNRWNVRLRDDLIASQVTEGPGTGSWKPRIGMHTRQGGRLLETSLATLTLQVYYRYKLVLPEMVAADDRSDDSVGL